MTLARKKQSEESVMHKVYWKVAGSKFLERENQHKISKHRITDKIGENLLWEVLNSFLLFLLKTSLWMF